METPSVSGSPAWRLVHCAAALTSRYAACASIARQIEYPATLVVLAMTSSTHEGITVKVVCGAVGGVLALKLKQGLLGCSGLARQAPKHWRGHSRRARCCVDVHLQGAQKIII